MITGAELLKIVPTAAARINTWLSPLNAAMERYEINVPTRQAAFLAQIAHESAGLSRVAENLNYTPDALLVTFNRKVILFTRVDAYRYGRTAEHPANQEMIANIAYASRMGNGPMESGDGWRYRGRGPGQLTGKSNYARCGAALGLDLMSHPELVERPDIGCMAFGWFWVEGNAHGIDLNHLADAGDIEAISRAVNGGDNGMKERVALYETAREVLV
jgi:putative chitinase